MKALLIALLALFCPLVALAQDNYGFPYGQPVFADFDMKVYDQDTSAAAYVIKEVAEAHFDYDRYDRILVTYHVKIHVLRKSGIHEADVEVYLYKSSGRQENIRSIQASAFNLENNRIVESKMDSKAIFIERNGERYDVAKFAIPNVKIGSVLEYQYVIESPFIFNFRRWEFQSRIPKIHSEYRTVIPANYLYNITLRGFQQLTGRNSDIISECISSGNGASADCVRTIYIMKNVPAFRDEAFMLARNNFVSAINFELSEVKHWDGRVDRITKEWKDADLELKQEARFGQQIRKGAGDLEKEIDRLTAGETDKLAKAKKIYDFIKFSYSWNGRYSSLTNEKGIKKAFEEKKGTSGDINLSLIASLRYAGFDVEPVLLATRQLERPIELHPVLSDFNYVICKLNLDGKVYLLDAVDDFLAFGNISEECYNGKGRVFAENGSYWMDLKPTDRHRTVVQANLVLGNDGVMRGTITSTSMGYAATNVRRIMEQYKTGTDYLDQIKSTNPRLTITSYEKTVDDNLSRAVVEKLSVEIPAFDSPETTHTLFNPMIMHKTETNPFKSERRMFPIDYGVPFDISLLLNVEYPEGVEIASLPDPVSIALPGGGGRYLYSAQNDGKKLTVNSSMSISRAVYNPEEYPALRELYTRMIQVQNTDIIIRKK